MTNEISIIENKRVGILKVKHKGNLIASLNYCREGREDERCYPTREQAIELARTITRRLVASNPVMTERGIDFCPKDCIFQDE